MTRTPLPGTAQPAALERSHARPALGPIALALAPLALLAGNLIGAESSSDEAERMRAMAADPAGEQAKILLFLAATTLLLVGTAAMVSRLGDRGARLGRIGAALVVPGLVAFAGLVTTWLYDLGLATTLPAAEAADISASAGTTGAAAVVLVVGLLAMPIGLVTVVAALWRAGVTAIWAPALVLAGFVVLGLVHNQLGGLAGDLLLVAGLARVGLDLSRVSPVTGTRRERSRTA